MSTPGGDPESILDGPALTPPAGVVPNFDDPPNSNTTARAIMAVCLTIGSIFFLLRTYSTWFVVKKPRMSECRVSPSFLSSDIPSPYTGADTAFDQIDAMIPTFV